MESFFKEVCDQLGKLPKAKPFDVDVIEIDSYIIVKTDIPNVNPRDIKIYSEDIMSLTIHAIPSDNDKKIGINHRTERTVVEKKRTVQLPKIVIFYNATATYSRGTLTITLPIDETAKTFEKRYFFTTRRTVRVSNILPRYPVSPNTIHHRNRSYVHRHNETERVYSDTFAFPHFL